MRSSESESGDGLGHNVGGEGGAQEKQSRETKMLERNFKQISGTTKACILEDRLQLYSTFGDATFFLRPTIDGLVNLASPEYPFLQAILQGNPTDFQLAAMILSEFVTMIPSHQKTFLTCLRKVVQVKEAENKEDMKRACRLGNELCAQLEKKLK